MTPRAALRATLRRGTIRSWLNGLAVACILPAVAATIFVAAHSYFRERASIEMNTIGTARALMQAVDAELIGAQSALEVLATSARLQTGDLRGFYDKAKALLPKLGDNIVLNDLSGQQIINTLLPFGETLPREPDLSRIRDVVRTGRPAISDLFAGAATGKPVVAVSVPVFVDGKVAYVLAIGLFPDRLATILGRQHIPPEVVVAILDRTGTIVARTLDPHQFVGRKGAPQLLRRMAEVPEGVVESPTLEGIRVLASFSRSPISSWSVAIGTPVVSLTADLRSNLLLTAAGAGLVLLLDVLVAGLISRRICRSIGALRTTALALAAGDEASIAPTDVLEIDEVSGALLSASQERQRLLRQTEQLQSELLHVSRLTDMGHIAAALAHEVNQPLASAANYLGGCRLLLEKDMSDAHQLGELRDRLARASEQVMRAGEIIRRTRNFLARGETERRLESAKEVLEEACALALVGVRRQGVTIRLEIHTSAQILTDRVQVQQVLVNLVRNAVDAMRDTPRKELTILVSEKDDMVETCVSDTGEGLSGDVVDRLFEPFASTKPRGMGIGLSVCRKIVEDHGGKIRAQLRPGGGTTFCFTVPVVPVSCHAG